MTEADRGDRDAWSDQHRANIRLVYSLCVGALLIIAGVVVSVWAVTNDTVDNINAGLGVALVVCGLTASMPKIALPLLSAIIKRVPWGRNSHDLTQAVEAIKKDEEE